MDVIVFGDLRDDRGKIQVFRHFAHRGESFALNRLHVEDNSELAVARAMIK